jgi:hypothetical protein
LEGAEKASGVMTINSSVEKIRPQATRFEIFAGGGLAAVVIFSIGVFLLVVPVLGWIVGPSLMLAAGIIALVHLVLMFRSKPHYTGHCPYCGSATTAGEPGSISECAACKNTFVHREGQLCKIEETPAHTA